MAQDTTAQRNNAANGQQNTEQIKHGYESFSAPADASTNPYLDADKAQIAGQVSAVQGQQAATTGRSSRTSSSY